MKTIKDILETNCSKVNDKSISTAFKKIEENFEYIEKAIANKYTIKEVFNLLDKHKAIDGVKYNTFKVYYLQIKANKNKNTQNNLSVQNQVQQLDTNETIDKIFFKLLVKASDEKRASNWVRFINTLSKDQKSDLANALNSIDQNHKKGDLYQKLANAVS